MSKRTEYKNRAHIIVPEGSKGAANLFAKSIDPSAKAEDSYDYFTTALIGTGDPDDATPTHYSCSSLLTDTGRTSVADALGNFPGATVYVYRESFGRPMAKTCDYEAARPNPDYDPGETVKTFDEVATEAGLRRKPEAVNE